MRDDHLDPVVAGGLRRTQGRQQAIPGVLTSTKAGPEGYRKTHAFTMVPALVPVFRAAVHRYDKGPAGDPEAVVNNLALLYEELGRGDQARHLAVRFLTQHADDLAAWLAHRPDTQQTEGEA
ncbi:hypothetical protein [Streptomyces roseolus]|uniref:hypothetical protein n=1 Tax=Streptomyces roseolus TaxID=67358 RepID=UPI00378A38B2